MKLSGVLFLGLGDSLAAIIGKTYGKNSFFLTGKTMEGFFACTISMLVSFMIVVLIKGMKVEANAQNVAFEYFVKLEMYKNVCLIAIAAGISEAFTMQMDNLIVPYLIYLGLANLEIVEGVGGLHVGIHRYIK